jgi:hypothetical protein
VFGEGSIVVVGDREVEDLRVIFVFFTVAADFNEVVHDADKLFVFKF